ncbi:serine/threonine protein kinase [Fusarium austroafricanum]|uniref:Serine/threonine protein kinase n=1 Tax=Fusarium austroafricanum TaxID=2364996 RepID=A0A8H4KKE3_9HYPO|nr:serine/threonine protein kinase [Fusarium austroafricanum]
MTSQQLHLSNFPNGFPFSQKNLVGKGTVGEVFKFEILKEDHIQVFAVKRFLQKSQRDDFENEKAILDALAASRHPNITYYTSAWVEPDAQYLSFPLAMGDLNVFLNETPPPVSFHTVRDWVYTQMIGVCDAIRYTHESIDVGSDGLHTKRLGFHHDLKPANILLFQGELGTFGTWKITDFGSGTVKFFKCDSSEEIYNRKASTGDTVYSAPEYVVEGRVSRPKDVWSLGCIFLETLIWARSDEIGEVARFREARRLSNPVGQSKAVYWALDDDNKPYINPAVVKSFSLLEDLALGNEESLYLLQVIGNMLCLDAAQRLTAKEALKHLEHIIVKSD